MKDRLTMKKTRNTTATISSALFLLLSVKRGRDRNSEEFFNFDPNAETVFSMDPREDSHLAAKKRKLSAYVKKFFRIRFIFLVTDFLLTKILSLIMVFPTPGVALPGLGRRAPIYDSGFLMFMMPEGANKFSVLSSVRERSTTESLDDDCCFVSSAFSNWVFFMIIPQKETYEFILDRVFLSCSTAESGGRVVIILVSCAPEIYSGRVSFVKTKKPFFGILPEMTLEKSFV